jgi:hypothetical protein
VRESGYAGFRRRGIPLVHQAALAGPIRRRGTRHRSRPGNWPATRASPHEPSPRACSTSTARHSGCTDDDQTIWLTKDLVSYVNNSIPHLIAPRSGEDGRA